MPSLPTKARPARKPRRSGRFRRPGRATDAMRASAILPLRPRVAAQPFWRAQPPRHALAAAPAPCALGHPHLHYRACPRRHASSPGTRRGHTRPPPARGPTPSSVTASQSQQTHLQPNQVPPNPSRAINPPGRRSAPYIALQGNPPLIPRDSSSMARDNPSRRVLKGAVMVMEVVLGDSPKPLSLQTSSPRGENAPSPPD